MKQECDKPRTSSCKQARPSVFAVEEIADDVYSLNEEFTLNRNDLENGGNDEESSNLEGEI